MRVQLITAVLAALLCSLSLTQTFGQHEDTNPTQPKIAFLFLTHKCFALESLWYRYFAAADPKSFSIHMHVSRDGGVRIPFTSKDYQLQGLKVQLVRSIQVQRFSSKMVRAMLLLLKSALADPNNTHFIFVSDTTIPLVSVEQMAHALTTSQGDCVSSLPILSPTGDPSEVVKHPQWFSLCRHDATLLFRASSASYAAVLHHIKLSPDFWNKGAFDEMYFPTLLRALYIDAVDANDENKLRIFQQRNVYDGWLVHDFWYYGDSFLMEMLEKHQVASMQGHHSHPVTLNCSLLGEGGTNISYIRNALGSKALFLRKVSMLLGSVGDGWNEDPLEHFRGQTCADQVALMDRCFDSSKLVWN